MLEIDNSKPSLEEILAFSASTKRTKGEEEAMYHRICKFTSEDEALEGIKLFLDDHQYNFNELYLFSQSNLFAKPHKSTDINQYKTNWFKIAAIFTAIGLSLIIYYNISDNHYKQIDKYAFKDNGFYVHAGPNDNKTSFETVINLYREDKFDSALALLTNSKLVINQDTMHYLCGLLNYHNQTFDQAISELEQVNEPLLSDKKNYYLALCYLKKRNRNTAKNILESLQKNSKDNFIKSKSEAILKDQNIWDN